MSEIDDDAGLQARAKVVLLGLQLVSEGNVHALDAGAVRGGDVDHTPRGERSLHDFHRRRIDRARDDGELRAAVKAAEEALAIATGGVARQRTTRSWDRFIVERYEGWSTARVAEAENCHRTQVWRARERLGRNGKDGTAKSGTGKNARAAA